MTTQLRLTDKNNFTFTWFNPINEINEIVTKEQSLSSTTNFIIAEALASFLALNGKDDGKITWRYTGLLQEINIEQSNGVLNVNIIPDNISDDNSRELIFGNTGIIIKENNGLKIEGEVLMSNPLHDLAYFYSRFLNIEASLNSIPIIEEKATSFTAFFTFSLTTAAEFANDNFTDIRQRLEYQDFPAALCETNPSTMQDVGLNAWQLIGGELSDDLKFEII